MSSLAIDDTKEEKSLLKERGLETREGDLSNIQSQHELYDNTKETDTSVSEGGMATDDSVSSPDAKAETKAETLAYSDGDTQRSTRRSKLRSTVNLNSAGDKMKLKDSPLIKESGNDREGAIHPTGIIKKGDIKIFMEPELAEPAPSYTGLPLESFPSTKIKKDSLWPSRVSRKSSRLNSKESPSYAPTEEELFSIESSYDSTLKTDRFDSQSPSIKERDNIKPVALKDQSTYVPKTLSRTPKRSKQNSVGPDSPVRTSKRIKVISPKKFSKTNLAPSSVNNNSSINDRNDDETKDNDDFCTTCGEPGVFICCDSCPRSFHFTCCDPPLEDIPEDNWHCPKCISELYPTSLKSWNGVGLFGQLLNRQEGRNPAQFELPKNLRDETFIGVSTGENGTYQDESMMPELTYSKANGAQIPGFNRNDDLEIDSLYTKDGKPILCHRCGTSGLNHKTLIHCDYCPLVYHLDCLQDVAYIQKTIGRKWRCPNHIEDLLPDSVQRRKFKSASVIDASLHSHFLNVAQASNFIIKFEDQPYIKDGKIPNLQEYLSFQNDCFKFYNNSEISDNNEQESSSSRVPDFFQNFSNSNGISARASPSLAKILTRVTSDGLGSFVYRVPDKSVVLDFIKKVRGDHPSDKQQILDSIGEYKNQSRLEENECERDVVDVLLKVKETRPRNLNFDELVEVALKDAKSSPNSDNIKIDEEEIKDLLNIKKLMKIKGKEALYEFLKS